MSKQLTLLEGGREVEQYDPQQGLKNIAVAEAAKKHFARAKDATQLYNAIEAKLNEQRKFVRWWDGQEKHPGSRKGVAAGREAKGLPIDHGPLFGWNSEEAAG